MFILNTNNGLFQHFIPILRGCHSLFLLETLTEITRVIDTHHIGYLRHGILTGGYQLAARLIRISLMNSIGASPVKVFNFLKNTERLTASSCTKSSTTKSPLSMFFSISSISLSINFGRWETLPQIYPFEDYPGHYRYLFIGNSCNRSCLHQVLAVQSLQFLPLGKQVLYTCF